MKKLILSSSSVAALLSFWFAAGPLSVSAQGRPSGTGDRGDMGQMDRFDAEENAQTDVDNTRMNERYRMRDDELTAEDQSMSAAETKVVANIRSKVVSQDNLSTDAQNVKIIAQGDGKITLRGPVRSQSEKDTIERLARESAEGRTIDNQLSVKNK